MPLTVFDPPKDDVTWLRAYKTTIAYVWGCDDPECRCTQVVVERMYPKPYGSNNLVRLAEGTYFIEGDEFGVDGAAVLAEELQQAQAMAQTDILKMKEAQRNVTA